MKKCILLLSFCVLIVVIRMSAQTTIPQNCGAKHVNADKEQEWLKNQRAGVQLKILRTANVQMDSILKDVANNNKSKVFMINDSILKDCLSENNCYYYLGLAKQGDSLFAEIVNVYSCNSLIEFVQRGTARDRYIRKGTTVLGCVIYNNFYFFIMSFPYNDTVSETDVNSLFAQTDKEIIIKEENEHNSVFFIEEQSKLYEFTEGRIHLYSN